DAGVLRELVEMALELLGTERHPAVELAVQEFRHHVRPERAALVHGEHELAHEAADQHALAVGDRPGRRDEAGGARSAEAAGRCREQHLGAETRGADGGSAAGRAAAGDEHVEVLLDRNIAREPPGLHRSSYCASIPAAAVIWR